MSETRLVELETKLAYQEAAIETLSAEVARQQRQIDQMHSALRQVIERLPSPGDGAGRGSLIDEIPPHY